MRKRDAKFKRVKCVPHYESLRRSMHLNALWEVGGHFTCGPVISVSVTNVLHAWASTVDSNWLELTPRARYARHSYLFTDTQSRHSHRLHPTVCQEHAAKVETRWP